MKQYDINVNNITLSSNFIITISNESKKHLFSVLISEVDSTSDMVLTPETDLCQSVSKCEESKADKQTPILASDLNKLNLVNLVNEFKSLNLKVSKVSSNKLCRPPGPFDDSNNNLKLTGNYSQDYLNKYWVGLMDGSGDIQVNHVHKKTLQFRFILTLDDNIQNHKALVDISKNIKGNILHNKKKKFFTLSIITYSESVELENLLKVFSLYPPLTQRLHCKLNFVKECLKAKSVNWYLENRDKKYEDFSSGFETVRPRQTTYFTVWLTGYLEARGIFVYKKQKDVSYFCIRADTDKQIIEEIQRYFSVTSPVCVLKKKKSNQDIAKELFYFKTYRKTIISNIINHIKSYPFIGSKKKELDDFLSIAWDQSK
nr:LAGLIDADG homing endonuclease-like protein [Cladonia rangiferina]WBP63716.1 LAGLIDADG homing endonuclease-like protein [Cladonia rangiferina]WBP63734.1 LAGLIDADG homing endonuclease-like protein [Cladonia rangiferina]WBP63752.1 LAGLIDADG homing endonuclease-like protein [Cladonia rangiferina]